MFPDSSESKKMENSIAFIFVASVVLFSLVVIFTVVMTVIEKIDSLKADKAEKKAHKKAMQQYHIIRKHNRASYIKTTGILDKNSFALSRRYNCPTSFIK